MSNKKSKVVFINVLAEFSASLIFSLLYFIFISRHISEQFNLSYVVLAYTIGLSYFVAIYIPFHTYRIHIIPFISIIVALQKGKKRILLHKIPAQIIGAMLGVLVFNLVNENTTRVNIEEIQKISGLDAYFSGFINAIVAGVICYGFYVVKMLFKFKRLTGTILLGFLISIVFFMTGSIADVSALNPFGLLFYDLFTFQTIFQKSFLFILFSHFIAPLASTILVFLFIKDKFIRPKYKREDSVRAKPLT